jgi:hypothetical protein
VPRSVALIDRARNLPPISAPTAGNYSLAAQKP